MTQPTAITESQSIPFADDVRCPVDPSDRVTLEQTELLLQLQRDLLEEIVISSDVKSIVSQVCVLAEQLLPDSVATVMLLEKDELFVYCAPNVSPEAIAKLNGLKPGPNAGSCGNVVYTQKPNFVTNTLTDDRWSDLLPIAHEMGLKACWSVPVITEKNELVGTFALTSFETRSPTLFHRRLLDTCGYLIGIILRREKLEQSLVNAAYYDAWTGLPNRTKLQRDLARFNKSDKQFVLAFIGLNRFKSVNDTYGHETGDFVLNKVAERLSSGCNVAMGIYRIMGDEFAIVVESQLSMEALNALAYAIEDVLSPPFSYNDSEFYIHASVGFAYPLGGKDTVSEMMKRADTAMNVAKESNDQSFAIFTPKMSDRVQEQLQLERDLHRAVLNHEFEVYYQPVVTADTQAIHSLEALIRWHHPEKGLIAPNVFIPLAEEAGMIQQISTLVVDHALYFLNALKKAELPLCRVSINISGREFNHKHINNLMEAIEQQGMTDCFEFELLESYLMDNASEVISLLNSVRERGISIAIDDFGTGYSSLSYLKKFPIDKIKIDQSLVQDIVFDANDLAISKAVVAMSRSLNLKVVAEGVETQAHGDLLSELGVDYLQGYLFSKPITSTQMAKFIADHQ